MKKTALLINYYRYPNGDAGAIRQHCFAKLFTCLGYNVEMICMGAFTEEEQLYDGVPYISFRHQSDLLYYKILNYCMYKRKLKKFLNNKRVDLVFAVDLPLTAMLYLKTYAKKNRTVLIHDSVEWFSPEQFKYGKCSFFYVKRNLLNKVLIKPPYKVIAISSFLNEHFKGYMNCQTAIVPAVLDIKDYKTVKKIAKDKTVIVYAGSPGKKDFLKEIICAVALLELNANFELRIIGIDKKSLIDKCEIPEDLIEKIGDRLSIMGRISHEDVLKNMEEANFTILLRSSEQRYAKAGFPTKVVESMATATPVICNITSDLGKYIKDEINGICIRSCSVEDVASALYKAIYLSEDAWRTMSIEARKCAEDFFDYRKYTQRVKNLLEGNNETE